MRKGLLRPRGSFRTAIFRSLVLSFIIPLTGIAVVFAQDPTPFPNKGDNNPALVIALAQDGAQIAYNADTGQASFISATPGRPINQPTALRQGASGEEAARGFLSTYGSLFGIRDQSRELKLMKEKKPDAGRTFARFQQVYNNIPVIGGELIVQVDSSGNILSANGETLTKIAISTTPTVNAVTASQNALQAVAKTYGMQVADLIATTPELWIYDPTLITPDSGLTRLVWRIEVSGKVMLPIHEFVLIDAQGGGVALQFNQIDSALNRETYTASNSYILPGTPFPCNEVNPSCGDLDAQGAHNAAGATYNFYATVLGRDSIDNAGMTLVSTVHYRPQTALGVPYANAFWSGTYLQMVYGDAYTFARADDVVAHELTHGVTDFESNLFYYYQSGAINESLSDVFGELVDQADGIGTDTVGVRWLMGEDVSPGGAIRSMSNPPAFGDPDRITSSLYYVGNNDNAGVHTNSGVNNKAAYLMTDGGNFNGKTVIGLGYDKVAKIYYEVQSNLLSSGSDYADLYVALYQGCLNLVGIDNIVAGDCQQVRNATDAVAMNLQPPANLNYNPDAPLCPAGKIVENTYFFDDLESGTGNWAFNNFGTVNGWGYDTLRANIAHSGVHFLYADDRFGGVSNAFAEMQPTLVGLPANAYLHFAHFYAFEYGTTANYDGGTIEYTINNGGAWIGLNSFEVNGYNGVITPGFGNNLSGSQAFVRESRLYTSSRANLSALAGQDVRFRWRMSTDMSGYNFGWFVDDIQIYTCISQTAAPVRNYFTTDTPTLTWNRVSTATSYLVQVSKSTTFSPLAFVTSPVLPTNQLSVPTSPLTEGTYYWRVSANNGVTWSAVDSFVIDLP